MKDLKESMKFVWLYSKESKSKIFLYVVFNLIKVIINIAAPILTANLIVNLTDNELTRVLFIGLVIFAISLLSKAMSYLSDILSNKIYFVLTKNIQNKLGENILKINNSTLDNNSSGVFIQRMTSDADRFSDFFSSLIEYTEMIMSNLGVFIAVFILNKIIFAYFVIVVVVIYFINKKRIVVRNKDISFFKKSYEKLTGFIGELIRGTRDIKMLNSEKSFSSELDKRVIKNNQLSYKWHTTNNRYIFLRNSVKDTFDFILIILFVILLKRDLITLTSVIIIYNYSGQVSGLINLINNFAQSLKDFNLSATRIKEVLDDSIFPKETFGNIHLDNVEGNFEFKDVTFKYNKKDRKILDKISFKVNANETVAFVGKTGAGKTTIFNLLCKMYEPSSGKITIDGVDIKKLDKDSIRGNITIVSQNPYIFNMSIKDNLKLVKEDATNKEIEEVLKLACLDKLIKKLPNGINTVVGEGGVNLSGGEKQRLAIARALLQKTEIILFDEATSALDNETQAQIQKAIDNMKKDYTILIIAHRLSTIINADRILFLNNGKIEAEGTHKELLKTCKEYKDLYDSEIKNRE